MKILTPEEVEEKFGLSPQQVDQLEHDAANGILHGDPRGEVVRGRPRLFGEEMRQVGFKEPPQTIEAIDRRASDLGLRRSDYLRSLVEADLSTAAATSMSNDTETTTVKTLTGKRAADFWERWKKRAVFDAACEPNQAILPGRKESGYARLT